MSGVAKRSCYEITAYSSLSFINLNGVHRGGETGYCTEITKPLQPSGGGRNRGGGMYPLNVPYYVSVASRVLVYEETRSRERARMTAEAARMEAEAQHV